MDYDKALKAFMRKRSRLLKMGVPSEKLMAVPTLSDNATKKDISRAIDTMKSFTNRGADSYRFVKDAEGQWLSVREKNILVKSSKAAQKQANKAIDEFNRRYEDLPFYARDVKESVGTVKRNPNIDPMYKFSKNVKRMDSFDEMRNYMNRMEKYTKEYFNERDELWKQNMVKAIEMVHGEDGADLADLIENMSTEEFAKIMITNDISIGYVYTERLRKDELNYLSDLFGLSHNTDLDSDIVENE